MVIFPLKGARGEHLRSIYLKIYHQKSINEGDMEGMDGFEFKVAINTTSFSTFKQFASRDISLRFRASVCAETIVACLEGIGKRYRRIFSSKDLGGS